MHVGGTNGKGSTSHIIAEILRMAGYKVGRFTSPHIHSYLERFLVDGQLISSKSLKTYIDKIEEIINNIFPEGSVRPTEFELLTAIALQWFKDSDVDIAIIEVGMGGLYDSTNVIIPEATVITSVDLDHVEFLGNSITEVAYNKAGIIKPGVPVIVGEVDFEAFKVIDKKAITENAPLFLASTVKILKANSKGLSGYDVDIKMSEKLLENVFFSLVGSYQLENITTALTVIEVLGKKGYNITFAQIIAGLGRLKMPGRLELVSENPLVIVDVAHNVHAAKALSKSLNRLLPNQQKVLLCGMVDDKDGYGVLKYLGEDTSRCIITRPEGRRGQEWIRLKSMWQDLYPEKLVIAIEDIDEAVDFALNALNSEEYLLIGGSFYVLDKARRIFTST